MKRFILLKIAPILVFGLALFAFNPTKNPIPNIHPIYGMETLEVTSGYGMRIHPLTGEEKMHRGVDFKAPLGTPVMATADGIAVKVVRGDKGYGNVIVLSHENGVKSLYSQLEEIDIIKGEYVFQGDIIGNVGSTGKSTGPHLHYEILLDDKNVNPANYLGNKK